MINTLKKNEFKDNNYTKQTKEKIIPKRNENKESNNLYFKNYHSNNKIMLYKNIKK